MVRKKLAVAVLAFSALQANFADAMGLGNLSVKSALNQPLNAEIKLLDTGDLDPSQIKINLATTEDFQRAGVDRDYFLTNLKFAVSIDGSGNGTIKITTREPVVEPYLNFVIEARWPNGRLLREFAVLLDPPTFSASKAAAPIAPATSGAQPVKPKAAQPPVVRTETETTKSIPAADMSLPAADKSGEYRVQVYDTMAKIAARFKPASDVSVAQTMIAIQRANPNVFIRNNVNLIKSGYVLRLPSADEVRSITAEQATQEVEAQTQEWRGGSSSGSTAARAPAAGPQLDASAPEPTSKEGNYREQARLSIASSGGADKGASGKGVDALRQQLGESQEALEKGKRDNKELQSRLDDMERQIATLQRLITLKDEQLAAVQAKAAGDVKSTPQATPAPAEPSAAVPTPAPAEPAPAEAAAPVATPVTPPPPAPKPAPKPAAKPAVPPEHSSFEKLVENRYLFLGGGIAAIVAALGIPMLIKRQRRKAWLERQEESENSLFDEGDRFAFDTTAFDESPAEESAPIDETAIKDGDDEQVAAAEPKKTVRSETGDPIAESDIYIAYGRYQQAVDLLTTAIDAEPNRSDLRVKLLEVYIEMRNKDAFRQQFVALQGLGDSAAVAHVKDMMSSVDGISDWLDDLPGAGSSGSGAAIAVASAAAVSAAASAAPEMDLDLDFDSAPAPDEVAEAELDLNDDLAALETSFEADLATEEEVDELDLELDDDLLAGDAETGLADSFLGEPEPVTHVEPTHRFDNTFDSTDNFASSNNSFDGSFDGSTNSFAAPSDNFASADNLHTENAGNTGFVTPSPADDLSLDDGLELDLGDDDLDQALSNMGEAESLGDLEDMSGALANFESPTQAPVDLSADLDLPEEFDLSQTSTELPDVERFDGGSLETPDFEEPFVESTPAPQFQSEPELDVFAGLNQSAPAPVAPTEMAESGDDFDFLADADEVATKLDLARAYIDMGDTDGAKDILDEVMQEGTDTQKSEASNLLSRIG
ncbi:MAG: FimV/HubP family polar landmark protein [Spongiibacteraceae bacterium]